MNNQEKTIASINNSSHETKTIQISSLDETASEREYTSGHEIMKHLRIAYDKLTTEELSVHEWVKYYLLIQRTRPIMTTEMTIAFADLLKNAKVKILNIGQEDIYTAYLEDLDTNLGLTTPEELSR